MLTRNFSVAENRDKFKFVFNDLQKGLQSLNV